MSLDSVPDITSQLPRMELHFLVEPISKLYADNVSRFPVRYLSGNRYIMLEYHVNTNAILVSAFQ